MKRKTIGKMLIEAETEADNFDVYYDRKTKEVNIDKMKRGSKITTALVLVIAFSGCATTTKKEIAMKSQSERTDVFQEIVVETVPHPGFSDLTVKASLKKLLGKQTEDAFLLNIDGQSVTWNIMGRKEKAPEYDDKGQSNPERGEGMKYVLTKNLRLRPGSHKIFLALPAENVFKEISITLKDGETDDLEFKPVYRRSRHPMQHFRNGIFFFEVFMNGKPVSE